MRKISIFLLLILINFSFAQTYQFDLVSKYTRSNVKDKILRDHVQYNNTDDFSYFLELIRWDTDLTARIYDMERYYLHFFSVEETNERGEVQFQFAYLKSVRLPAQKVSKKHRYEIIETAPNELTLKIYNLKKHQKLLCMSVLTLQKSNKNLVPIYTIKFLSKYFGYNHSNNFGNFFVSKATEKVKEGEYETNWTDYKNVDFQIILPKKLKVN